MSKQVDERVVSMQFDNKQFESGVQTSLSTLDKLKQSLNMDGASKGLENVNDAAKKVNLSALGDAAETVKLKFSALEIFAISALQNIANKAVNAGERIVSALTIDPIKTGFSEYELKMGSVQTIMASTGADLQTVNRYLEELNLYADKTIYSFSDMTENIGKFTNNGVKLEDAVKAIQGISNEAALAGSNANQASAAMYNFSQALSAGYVKLIDWKSIENAGMATVEFKNQLLETAASMGIVKKNADGMYTVLSTNINGSTMDDTISATKNFNDSLQYQWMTSEVLIETLGKYADETTDIGAKATQAATEVKTLSQLFDTLKESAQSGWAQSWEIIVGDYEEAKVLFTELSDIFGGILNDSANARNNLLEGALGGHTIDLEAWNKFATDIGSTASTFQKALTETAKSHNIDIDSMINKEGSFEATLKNGWLTNDLITETFENLNTELENTSMSLEDLDKIANQVMKGEFGNGTERIKALTDAGYDYATVQGYINHLILGTEFNLEELSDAQLKSAGYTDEQIAALRELAKTAEETGTPLNELMKSMNKPSGRELLIDSFRNILSSIGTICKSVKEAFQEVFPPMTSEQLYNLIEGFHALTEKFKIGDTAAANIKRTFKGLFSVVGIVTDALKAIWDVAIGPLIDGLSGLSGGLFSVTANFGGWLVALRDTINESGIVTKVMQAVVDAFEWLGNKIEEAYGYVKPFIDEGLKVIGGELSNVCDRLGDTYESFKTFAKDGLSNVTTEFSNFKEVLEKVCEAIKNFVTNGIDWLGNKFNGLRDAVKGVFEPMETFASEGLETTNKHMQTLKENAENAISPLDKISQKIKDAFGSDVVKEITEAFSDVTLQDAIGAGLLAAIALVIKKFVDKISDFVAPLQDVMTSVSEVLGGVKGCLEAWQQSIKADTLLKIAGAVALLAASIFALSFVDGDKLAGGLVGVSALLAEVVGTLKLMSSDKFNTEGLAKSTGAIVVMSVAITILAKALATLDGMNFGQIMSSLVGLLGAMGGLVASMKFLSKMDIDGKEFIKTSIGLVLFAIAIGKMADSMVTLGQLSFTEIITGLGTMAGILVELGLFLKYSGLDKIGNASSTITAIAVSMLILYAAVSLFGKMEFHTLVQGLGTVAALLIGLGVAIKVMDSANLKGTASTIMALAVAIGLLVIPIKMLGEMDFWTLVKGLGTVALALVGITAAMTYLGAVQKNCGSFAKIGTSLLLMAAALAIIAIPIKTLGSMPWEGVALGLGALVIALVAFGVTATLLAPLGPALTTVAAALALFGVAVAGIGGGMLMLATGFTMLATLGSAGALAVAAALSTIIVSLLAAIPGMMQALELAIKAFAEVIINCAPVVGDAITAILIEICNVIASVGPALIETVIILIDALLQSIAEHLPSICDSAASIIITLLTELAEHMGEFTIVGIEIILAFLDGVQSKMGDVTQKAFDLLLEFIKSMTESIKTNTPLLVTAMHDLIIALVDAGIQVLTGGIATFEEAGQKIMDSGLISGIFSMLGNLLSKIGEMLLGALKYIKEKFPEWVAKGKELIKEFIKGIGEKAKDLKDEVVSLIKQAKEKIEEKFEEWKGIGKNLIAGFIEGVKAKAQDLINAAKGVVEDAIDGAKALLGIKSPSRVFKQIGIYCDEGMIIGLNSMAGAVSKASEGVGEGAINAVSNTIANIADVINNDIDAEPTIRPVLDLSNVTSGVRQIDAAFSRTQALSISASRSQREDEIQNGETTSSKGNTYQFTQNNYSPKALSRVEIYRQTKNQFSAMERMIES